MHSLKEKTEVSPVTEKKQIYGLNYLRAIACIFVVIFHVSPISMDFWYARAVHVFIFASAVPIFILISLFLTELKIERHNYLLNKSYRLGKIYLLWAWLIPGILFLIARSSSALEAESLSILDGRNIYSLIVNGANWPYKVYGVYFLVYLIILSWIYWFLRPYMKSYARIQNLFYGFCIINLFLPYLPAQYHPIRESFVPFLIYLPLTKSIYYNYQKSVDYWRKAREYAFIYIIVTVFEAGIIAMSNRVDFITYNYAPYSRLSIVFLAAALVYISFTFKRKLSSSSEFLALISSCSLGIYLIHGFLIDYFRSVDLNSSSVWLFLIVFSLSIVFSSAIKELPLVKRILIL